MDAPAAEAQAPSTPEKNGERARAVDAAILQIEKQFGRGAIMRLGDRGALADGSFASLREVVAAQFSSPVGADKPPLTSQ